MTVPAASDPRQDQPRETRRSDRPAWWEPGYDDQADEAPAPEDTSP